MEQYISKSALVAEIERLEKINQEYKKTWKWKFKWFYHTIIGRLEVLEGLKNFLDTLEVKEADLEKELNMYLEKVKETDEDIVFKDFAKHFFELGLKAQKDLELTNVDIHDICRIYDGVCLEDNIFGFEGISQEMLKRYKAQKGEQYGKN